MENEQKEIISKITKLRKTIPFKWRVQSEIKSVQPVKLKMIAYVDARDVSDHLDAIVGPNNWCDKYEEVKGNLFCSIGIKIGEDWVYKSDCGTESRTEKEKGESSDAFKRAAVKWGINRDAYRVGIIEIQGKEYGGKYYPCDDKGKFLKGQALYDYCNTIAKITDFENYDLETDEELEKDIEHKKLQSLFESKKDFIPADDFDDVKSVIDKKQIKAYPRIKIFLENIKIPQ